MLQDPALTERSHEVCLGSYSAASQAKRGTSGATQTVEKIQRPSARSSSRSKILQATTDQMATGMDDWIRMTFFDHRCWNCAGSGRARYGPTVWRVTGSVS